MRKRRLWAPVYFNLAGAVPLGATRARQRNCKRNLPFPSLSAGAAFCAKTRGRRECSKCTRGLQLQLPIETSSLQSETTQGPEDSASLVAGTRQREVRVSGKFSEAVVFGLTLGAHDDRTWSDRYGDYRLLTGTMALKRAWDVLPPSRVLVSDFVEVHGGLAEPVKLHVEGFLYSVGAFAVHNRAREVSRRENIPYVSVPAPLSNDSFATRRFSIDDREAQPSLESTFPKATVIDTELLLATELSASVAGIGEFVGLYYSYLDYCETRSQRVDVPFVEWISAAFLTVTARAPSADQMYLHQIAQLLLIKGLVMRVNDDHQIGCGADHLFARLFERTTGAAHGKAVYLGCLLVARLFPSWAVHGLSSSTLEARGLSTGVISAGDLAYLSSLDLKATIRNAVRTRPARKSVLWAL